MILSVSHSAINVVHHACKDTKKPHSSQSLADLECYAFLLYFGLKDPLTILICLIFKTPVVSELMYVYMTFCAPDI